MSTQPPPIKGGIPQFYDLGLGPNIFDDLAQDLATHVSKYNPANLLEIACGTGIATRHLRNSLNSASQIIATDIVKPMLDVAESKFSTGEQITFETADAMNLPFADNIFEAVICQFGVMLFPDKDASYREAFRVIKPGGRYSFNVWSSIEENTFARITHETIADFFDNDPPGFWNTPFSYHDTESISDSLRSAGFKNIDMRKQEVDKSIENYDRFSQGLIYGNPVINEIRERKNTDPDSVCSALALALRSEFGNKPDSMPLRALMFTAQRPS